MKFSMSEWRTRTHCRNRVALFFSAGSSARANTPQVSPSFSSVNNTPVVYAINTACVCVSPEDCLLNKLTKINRMDIVHLIKTQLNKTMQEQTSRTYSEIERTLDHSEGKVQTHTHTHAEQ